MTVPLFVLQAMVYVALTVSAAAPVVLLVLLFRDWKRGNLW